MIIADPADSRVLSNVWILDGEDLVRAGLVIGRAPAIRAERLLIYDRIDNVLSA